MTTLSENTAWPASTSGNTAAVKMWHEMDIHEKLDVIRESQANIEQFIEQFGMMMQAVQPMLEKAAQNPMVKAFIGG